MASRARNHMLLLLLAVASNVALAELQTKCDVAAPLFRESDIGNVDCCKLARLYQGYIGFDI